MTETALRLLRDGRQEGQPAPVLAFSSSCAVLGGDAIFRHLLASLQGAVAGGRAQARYVCLVATEKPPRDYLSYLAAVRQQQAQAAAGSAMSAAESHESSVWESIQVVDGFSDPLGWNHGGPSASSAAQGWTQAHAAAERAPDGGASASPAAPSGQDSSIGARSTAAPTSHALARLDDMVSLEGAVMQCLQRQTAAAAASTGTNKDGGQKAGTGAAPVGSSHSSIVVFDSLAPLFRHHPQSEVFSTLESLRWERLVSGLLFAFPEDTIPLPALQAIQYFAQATLSLRSLSAWAPAGTMPESAPVEKHGTGGASPSPGSRGAGATPGPLEPSDRRGHHSHKSRPFYVPCTSRGVLELKQKRRTGRVLHVAEEFELLPNGRVRVYASKLGIARKPEEEAAGRMKGPEEGPPPAGAAPAQEKMAQSKDFQLLPFRLDLSEEERAAREQVVLPYEHQGRGREVRIYDGRQSMGERGGHWGKQSSTREPLEPAARLEEAAAQQVEPGTIHYLRDSDDEAPDSDEDPDDDLDI